MSPVASLATFSSQKYKMIGSRKLTCLWSIGYWLFQIKGIRVPWLCLQWGYIFPHRYSDSPDSWQFWHTGQDTCARAPSGGGGVYTMRRAAPWRHGMWRVLGTRVPKFWHCYCNEHTKFGEGAFSMFKAHFRKHFAKWAIKLILKTSQWRSLQTSNNDILDAMVWLWFVMTNLWNSNGRDVSRG